MFLRPLSLCASLNEYFTLFSAAADPRVITSANVGRAACRGQCIAARAHRGRHPRPGADWGMLGPIRTVCRVVRFTRPIGC